MIGKGRTAVDYRMSLRRPPSERRTRALTDGGTDSSNDASYSKRSEYRDLLRSYEPVEREELASALLSALESGDVDEETRSRLRAALGAPDRATEERLDRLEAEVSRLRETVDLLARRQRVLLEPRRGRER